MAEKSSKLEVLVFTLQGFMSFLEEWLTELVAGPVIAILLWVALDYRKMLFEERNFRRVDQKESDQVLHRMMEKILDIMSRK